MTHCCDVCEPELFEIKDIIVRKAAGLIWGYKKILGDNLPKAIQHDLQDWHKTTLLFMYYPKEVTIASGATLLSDNVIDCIVSCGIRLFSDTDLWQNLRWFLAFDKDNRLLQYGTTLLAKLSSIYNEFDAQTVAHTTDKNSVASTSTATVPVERFYASLTAAAGSRPRGPRSRKGWTQSEGTIGSSGVWANTRSRQASTRSRSRGRGHGLL